jgi:MFS family permease
MQRARFFRGWTMVIATHVLFALIFGAMYSFGAFLEHVQASFGTGRFGASSLFAVTAFLYYAWGLVSGGLADRLSARRVLGCGILLLALGFGLGSLAPNFLVLLLVFCALVGAGVGLVYVPAIAVVQRWFIRHRSRASGLALAGTGVGTFIGPVVAAWLLQSMSWRAAMQCVAAVIALLGVAAAMQLVLAPEDMGLMPDGDPPRSATGSNAHGASRAQVGIALPQALASTRFWWYFASILFASVGLFAALVHILPFARGLGASSTQGSLLIGLIGIGNVAGRLVLGGLGDRIGAERLLMALTLALAALNCVWLEADGFWMLAIFALLFGAANGGCIALYPAVAAGWFGTARFGSILGALYVSVGLAALIGASAAGLMFDLFQSDAAPIAVSAALAVLAAACLALAGRREPRHAEHLPEKHVV